MKEALVIIVFALTFYFLVGFANWEKKSVKITLGIPLPEGKYTLSASNLKGKWSAQIDRNRVVSDRVLNNFALTLTEGETMLLFISGIQNTN